MVADDPTLTRRSAVLGVPNLLFVEKLGEGGMAVVWKAWDTINQRMVAVKILNEEFSGNPEDVRQFRYEHQLLEEVRDPGVVSVYDFAFSRGRWYMTMEYIDGYDFASLLERKKQIGEEDCLLICESVARTLEYVWNDHGIVHCDIKPDNIMINTDGVVKLTDMGISHRYVESRGKRRQTAFVNGSPAYISPEQVRGERDLDCRADIYSLGATLYHLSTGQLLFPALGSDATMAAHCSPKEQAPDARQHNAWLSQGFVQLLEYMLVKDRDQRLSSWHDVYEMCRQIENRRVFAPRESSAASTMSIYRI